jgi:FAD/FMN-containing dehydrogenase
MTDQASLQLFDICLVSKLKIRKHSYNPEMVSTLFWSLATAFAFISTVASFDPRQIAVGPAACANLTGSLGSVKVVTSQLDPNYLESQFEYWNARLSNYAPSCVVYPTSAQDVSIAVQAIRTSGSRFAVRVGGHNPNPGFSSVDQGVLIDLRNLNQKSYDPVTTLASYQPGQTFGEVYEYFAQYGRTVVGARLAGVGTGLALGGGLSYLSSQYGLAADSFREMEVVLPSGEIVTASGTENSDLFFACKGGGGNAYGIITKYTVQSRPSGTFTAGIVAYLFDQTEQIGQALADFTRYNTDPKAAIIGTYETLGTPDLTLNLDKAGILFLVYDGEDPGDVFDNFTNIPHILNTLGPKTYLDVINMPIPLSTELSRGDNFFRVQAHRIDDDSWKDIIATWKAWTDAHKGTYILTSLDWQPIPKTLTDASKEQGGNAMDMPDGPWMWFNYLLTTIPGMAQADYDAIQASFKQMVESTQSLKGLPLFINDAAYDQNPLKTFSTYSRLQGIKKKYDPDSFFASKTGGWNFEA